MNINSLYNIFTLCLVSYRLKFLTVVSSLFLLGFSGYGQLPTVSISNNVNGLEGGIVPGSFTVTVEPDLLLTPGVVDVQYSVMVLSTATAGFDYTILVGPVSVNYDATGGSANITVDVIDDLIDEVDETVNVMIDDDPINYNIGSSASASVTIVDNDNAPTVAFNATASNGLESVSSAALAVSLSAASGRDVTVNYAVSGTATGGGTDYTLANGTLTILAGSLTGNINITGIVDDLIDESNETVGVTLSSPGNATLGTNTVHTYTITDNDNAPTVAFNTTASSGLESVSSAALAVSLSAASGSNVTVNYAVSGTATGGGTDYTLANGTLTILAGSLTGNINITGIVDDLIDESNETVGVTLSSPGNATLGTNTVHTYTITDNDNAPTVAFNTTASSGLESVSSAALAVSLSAASGSNVTVNYAVSGTATGGGTDYTLANGTLTILAGSVTGNINITGIVDDLIDEPNETVEVTLSFPGNSTLGTNTVHTYTITDNDNAPTVAFNTTVSSGLESVSSAALAVSLSAASGSDVTVNYAVTGTASGGGTDYTLANGTLTILAGSLTGNINITGVVDDLLDEPNETVVVTLSSPTNAALGTNTIHTYTILDNDVPVVTITATDPDAAESPLGTGTYTVSLDAVNASGFDITINYTVGGTAASGSDFNALSGTVVIANGQETNTILLTPIDDNEVEAASETVIVALATGTGYTVGSPNNATVNIASEDAAGVSINDVTVNENDGSANFTVTLNGGLLLGTTVTYSTANSSALAGSDYVAKSGSVTFAPLIASQTRTITIDIIDDAISEGTESFFVNLINATGFAQISKERGVGTIADNDNCMEAPLINSTPTIFCDVFSQNLDAYTDSTIPPGFELIWSSSNDFSNTGARLATSIVDFPATFYGFLFNSGTGCTSPPLEVTLVRNEPPEILSTTPATICGPGSATISATVSAGGSLFWYSSESGGASLGEGANFTALNNEATTIYYVEATANGCTTDREAVTVTVAESPDTGTTTNSSACSVVGESPNSIDLDITRTGGDTGVWNIVGTPPGSITIGADNIVNFEGAPDGDYVFRFTTNTAVSPCVNESVDVTITVSTCTMDSDGDGLIDRDEITLGLDPNNKDSDADGIEDGVEVGPDVSIPIDTDGDGIINALDSNILDSDNDGVVDQLDPANDNPCIPNISDACQIDLAIEKVVDKESILVGGEVTFTITLTNLSQIMVTNVSVNELIDPALGFRYVIHTTSKGAYNEILGVWQLEEVLADEVNTLTITVGVPEVGTYQNIASIVDAFPEDGNAANNLASATVNVTPRSSDECGFLFNQISPNADGTNDTVYINCIEDYPNNTFEIFDRYGNEVFAASGYDNTWMGTGKNGDLPKGTYFYILDLGDGTEVRKGWIQIIR